MQEPMAAFPAAIGMIAEQAGQTLHQPFTMRTVRVIELALWAQH
jgi:hypothetical protein